MHYHVMHYEPPTSYLPPIKLIATYPLKTLNDALNYLRRIYNTQVRGSRRRRTHKNALLRLPDQLDTDTFERNYAIKWLIALISQLGNGNSDHPDSSSPISTEDLIQNAASLLAICAGTASAGTIVRQFVFENAAHPPSNADTDTDTDLIKIELVDVPLDNHDYRSVGAQTWGGACIMAEMIVEHPTRFGFHQLYPQHSTFRCLELGAGTGLVSLTVTKMMQRSVLRNTKFQVVATDYYPSVMTNLQRNIDSNFPDSSSSSSSSVRILTRVLDWSTFSSEPIHEPVFQTPFDLILGADIIYESQHALWIKSCLTTLLRKPSFTSLSSSSDITSPASFHLVIPLRATHTSESTTIEQVFPFHNNR